MSPASPNVDQDHVAAYKRVLPHALDNRPSGMRQRLAEALGKNRSFDTQPHAGRLQLRSELERVRRVTLSLPDLGDQRKNKQIEEIVAEFAEKIARVLREQK